MIPDQLLPYIAGATPDERGEVEMFCPLHPDSRRSASLNLDKEAWFCFAGCGGGSIRHLLDTEDHWEPMDGRQIAPGKMRPRPHAHTSPSIDVIEAYNRRLLRDEDLMEELLDNRGIRESTVKRALIGHDGSHYKIPVFSPARKIWNIRSYDMNPGMRRKIWSVRGMGQPRLYPIGMLERAKPGDEIIICEGEWDALLTLQSGHLAVTRTGSADVWRPFWSRRFKDLKVYLCHDADEKGQRANEVVAQALGTYPESVHTIELPFPITANHGKDLTDLLLDMSRMRRGRKLYKLKSKARRG